MWSPLICGAAVAEKGRQKDRDRVTKRTRERKMREQNTQRRKRGDTNPQERDHVKGEKQGWMELNTKMDGGDE